MARFDVYRRERSTGYLLDLQSDFLRQFDTRVVVPLLLANEVPPPTRRLHPVFCIEENDVVMATQMIAAVPRGLLRNKVTDLSDHRDEIVSAIDFLMQGF